MNNEIVNQQNPKFWMEFGKTVANFLSVPPCTLTHEKPGIRYCNVIILMMNAAGMTLFAIFFPEMCKPVPFILPLWGIAALVRGIICRHRRYQELIRGDFTHTYSNGTSRLERLSFWPRFLQAESRIVRWIEPGLFWLVGLISTFFLSRAFGCYLMLSSVFLAAFQELVYQTSLNHLYDLIDSDITANAQSRLLGFLTTSAPSAAIPKSIEGVPTGAARDLMAALERRKARKMSAPDNLAPASRA